MSGKRYGGLIAMALLCALLTGCNMRSRVISMPAREAAQGAEQSGETALGGGGAGESGEDGENDTGAVGAEPDANAPTFSDPNAQRREYDANASALLEPDAQTPLWIADEPSEQALAPNGGDAGANAVQTERAERTATQTLTQEEAERRNVSDTAPKADTIYEYYEALLSARVESLFECKRLNVYWETGEDYTTVFRTSVEHDVIRASGGYDVSAKRLEDALVVDDGWISRKNPGCVVKCVSSALLGEGVQSALGAKQVYAALIGRPSMQKGNVATVLLSEELMETRAGQLAAALYIAKRMYPDSFSDLDPDVALRELTQESTGVAANGIYAYSE